ncbi:MAG TPA: hypothetical protein VFX59_05035 [Polyangiales bacterium]|nr:hypothetical protein [Polyangiales bacterium]
MPSIHRIALGSLACVLLACPKRGPEQPPEPSSRPTTIEHSAGTYAPAPAQPAPNDERQLPKGVDVDPIAAPPPAPAVPPAP